MILERSGYDDHVQTAFKDLYKPDLRETTKASASSPQTDYKEKEKMKETVSSPSKIETEQTSLMDEIDALLGF